MARRKKAHFAQMKLMPHVFEFPENMAGKWKNFFKNENKITLEIGCGTGNYTIGMASLFPSKNFIGLDIKGDRMWHGATAVQEKEMKNVAFLRTRIEQLCDYFEPEEVKEIWITFPDPHPRDGKIKKRLTSPRFLDLYQKVLGKNNLLHLKTDNQDLFDYSLETWQENKNLEILKSTKDLYATDFVDDVLEIKTVYEKKFLAQGLTICYLKAKVI